MSVSINLSSRVFSVTGGASGMGAATARLLAQHGAAAVWIADWNDGNFQKIKDEIDNINPLTKVYTTKVDVSDPKQVDDWVAAIIAESGVLHGAANVAGLSQSVLSKTQPAILAESSEEWTRVMSVNINGILYCTRAQVAAMIKMPREECPALVNVSSMASLLRGPSAFAYGASKAACAHFTSCVAKDVASFGIRANTVSPGNTYTPMTKEFFGEMSRDEMEDKLQQWGLGTKMLEPEEVARVIVWLLSGASMGVNGVNLPVGPGAP
ncbi:oxidoreductase [Fusarium mundagurra]|uniref:Oxidoreductase n=1 Tax=Fusarium mundagurra TaxID=1567541 RepID=A0A8H5XYY2_9HYPO|nr:oxidoreductase [Fusarium mundagurra]